MSFNGLIKSLRHLTPRITGGGRESCLEDHIPESIHTETPFLIFNTVSYSQRFVWQEVRPNKRASKKTKRRSFFVRESRVKLVGTNGTRFDT